MRYRPILGGVLITALLGGTVPSPGLAATPSRITLFAGLQGGFVYRSTDDGATWQESDTGIATSEDVTALAVGAGSRGPIYAGTGGGGVFISTDNGSTWQDDNGGNLFLQQGSMVGLAASPTQPGVVYAASDVGVFSSVDGGAHWSGGVWSLWPDATPTCLALDPGRPGTIAAGTQRDGIIISTDSGRHWNLGIGASLLGTVVNQIAFDPMSADVAYAATSGGVYQTLDGGQTWQPENRGIPDGTEMSAIAVDPHHGASVITADASGDFYGSNDGGASWHDLGNVGSAQGNTILYDPVHSGTIFAGNVSTGGGAPQLYSSTDGGVDWQPEDTSFSQGETILSLAAAVRPALPTDPIHPPHGNPRGVRFFAATGHSLRAPFLDFYNKHNGLKIFGLPLTESYREGGRLVQYFERTELVDGRFGVQEAPLGTILTGGRHFAPIPAFISTASRWYFPSTRHSVSGAFLDFWRNHSGALLFGNPISEPVYEQNGDGTHRTYLVQYFQNARMEYHTELAGTSNVVTLGQLGRQYLHQRGWL